MSSETGATPEQIEAAARRLQCRYGLDGSPAWDGLRETSRQAWITMARRDMPCFVPPDHRIVGPDAVVLTAEEAATAERRRVMADDVLTWEPHEFDVYLQRCSFCTADDRPLYRLLNGYGQAPFDEFSVACRGCLRNLRAAIDEALDDPL